MKKERTITIFNTKIASELVQKGFRIVNMQPNNFDKEKTVFYFEYTEELVDILDDRFGITIK